MQWALIGIAVFGVILAYVVWQGMRAANKYRELAAAGDLPTIRLIVDEALAEWHSGRPPKGLPPTVWAGVQTMEVVDVGSDYVHVSCSAEGEYKMVDGRWLETKSPLQEGMAITAKATEMLLYELPHLRLDRVVVDVYTTYRDAVGVRRELILSCDARREDAREVDWDDWTPQQITESLGARYRLGEHGQALPLSSNGETAQPPAEGPQAAL
jgi:hypothetical protein